MEVTRVELRAYIKIAVLRGRNAMECHSELVEALRNTALSYCSCTMGKKVSARTSSDEQRSRRPVSVWTDLARAVIEQLMHEDRRLMLLELERASWLHQETHCP
ncbi:HTH_48 domain-containing protein [Trichonephila clavipes]|nr:HTH_48 domain-containing protein [Trichonephila clavipes]